MNEVNFLVMPDTASIHSGKTAKIQGKPEQVSKDTPESISNTLFKSLLTSFFETPLEKNGNEVLAEVANLDKSFGEILPKMDEVLSLLLLGLNEMREPENNLGSSQDLEEMPEDYFGILEDVMSMIQLLTTLNPTPQKESQEVLESFSRLSERVLMFIKGYFEKDSKRGEPALPTVKVNAELKELIKMIETRLDKLLPLERNAVTSSLQVTDSVPVRSTTITVPEVVFPNGAVSMNQLQLPKQTTIQWVIDTTSNEAAREQLLSKLEGILAKTQARYVNGNQTMTIRLAPEHLGTLHIKLQETQHGFVAKLIVHSKSAASLLESGMTNLKQALAQSNVNMEKLEVVFQEQEQKFTQQHKGTNDGESHSKHFSKRDSNDEDDKHSFEEVLLEELEIKKAEGDGE